MSDSQADNPAPPPGGPVRLNGWKDIASYLDRGVRTVQRWEKVFGLPVRRLGSGRSEGVFAFRHELDEWQATAQAARARSDSLSPSIDSGGEAAEPGVPAGSAEPSGRSASGFATTAARDRRLDSADDNRRLRAAVVVLAAAMVLVVAWAAWSTWQVFGRPGAGATLASPAGEPASWRVEGDTLVVLDAAGRICWTRQMGTQLHRELYATQPAGLLVRIGDLDGDGRREVLFVAVPLSRGMAHARLYAFNQDGSPRWEYQHAGTATFGTDVFSGPWVVYRTFLTEDPADPKRHALWVSSHDAYEFPALLVRLDIVTGKTLTGPYWSHGWVGAAALLRSPQGPRLALGVTNNERHAPGVVVLDATNITGAAPAELPKYRCTTCPAGEPLAMAALPKPRRFVSASGGGGVDAIETAGADTIIATATYAVARTLDPATAVFRLDASLHPLRADPTDSYWPAYEQLVRDGTIPAAGPLPKDPTSELLPILRWDSGSRRYVPTPLARLSK